MSRRDQKPTVAERMLARRTHESLAYQELRFEAVRARKSRRNQRWVAGAAVSGLIYAFYLLAQFSKAIGGS